MISFWSGNPFIDLHQVKVNPFGLFQETGSMLMYFAR